MVRGSWRTRARAPAPHRRPRRSCSCARRPGTPIFSPLLLLLDLCPGVAQCHGAVEHELSAHRIGVDAEVAEALELEALLRLRVCERRTQQPPRTSSELWLMLAFQSWPSSTSPGSGLVSSRSYRRTSAGTAWAAESQCIVACTLRPSSAAPPRVAGSYAQRTSTTLPATSFTTEVQRTKYADRKRTSLPGERR